MSFFQSQTDLMERFYKIKLAQGLSAEQAMEKVKYKFSPTPYRLSLLEARIAGEPGASHAHR